MKRVAVIGAGISGMAAAYLLSRRYEVHLFERESRLGGHTHTVRVDASEGELALDTGFLVYNERTYPLLTRLFEELRIATRDADMSFAIACRDNGLEYSSRGATGFFAQPSNLLRPAHFRLLAEILRFNREAPALLQAANGATDVTMTLGDFLDAGRFGDEFRQRYLLPMASAIWSASLDAIRSFPALTFVRFFANHGLLALRSQPTWKVVEGGSDRYVPRLTDPFRDRIHCDARIAAVHRGDSDATLTFVDRPAQTFDEVVLACHGDQVLPLLANPTATERELFAGFTTTANSAWLHTDASVLPLRPRARASWNYLLGADVGAAPSVTYDLNRLQGLKTREQYCVTLNPSVPIDPKRVIGRYLYHHPLYTLEARRSQARWMDVSGVRHTHYCGAHWGYGFHEDGLQSAIRVAATLGVTW